MLDSNDLILKQLDRLEERTRNIATRQDLESLRRDLVARDALEPQLNAMKSQIARIELDRTSDKMAYDKHLDEIEAEILSRSDKLWMRISQLVGVSGFALALIDFLSHVKLF